MKLDQLVGSRMSGYLKLVNLFLMQLFSHSSAANCRWTESEWEFSISNSAFQCTIQIGKCRVH